MPAPELVQRVVAQFTLSLRGIHGVPHWARVLENGRRLAAETGARRDVVEAFALLHDSRRLSDGGDPEHGPRGAAYAIELGADLLGLDRAGLRLLEVAIRDHSRGRTDGDVTVQTCWDADRLDLGRVGLDPSPRLLCTDAARDRAVIDWAVRRSFTPGAPALVRAEWGLALPEPAPRRARRRGRRRGWLRG